MDFSDTPDRDLQFHVCDRRELRWSSGSHTVSTGTQGAFLPVHIFSKPRGFPVAAFNVEERETAGRECVEGCPPSCHIPRSVRSSPSTPEALCVPEEHPEGPKHCCAVLMGWDGSPAVPRLPCPAPASCLQLQTTKKAQVSNALKTSRHEAGPGAELAQSLGLVEPVFSAQMWQVTL